MDIVNHHIAELDKHLLNIETLKTVDQLLKDQTSKNPNLKDLKLAHIVLGIVGILFLLLLCDSCGEAITNFVGFLYPAYASIRALQTQETKDDTQWLTYWVVFGLLVVVEDFFYDLCTLLPFYFAIKFIFIIWLFYPGTLGAAIVYRALITNVSFLRHTPSRKEEVVESVKTFVSDKKKDADSDSEKDE